MKLTDVLLTLILVWMLALAASVSAKTPYIINYQGRLLDDIGDPIDDVVDMKFLIYDAPKDGHALWDDREAVTVVNGLFVVRLGQSGENLLDPDIFGHGETFLAVEIGGSEITREQFVASPYAIRSATSDHADRALDADFLGGQPPSDFAPTGHAHDAAEITQGTLSTDVYNAYLDLAVAGDLENDDPSNLLTQEQLDGRFSATVHGHDASDVTTGTLPTDVYNAYQDLNDAGYLNNDNNFDLLNRIQSDLRFATVAHDHSGFYIYYALNAGGYLDNTHAGDLLTISQASGRYAYDSHTHTPSPVQCKFQYHVADMTGAVMADGIIAADGSSFAGGPLNAQIWDATNHRYELTFTISGFSIDTHIAKITPISDQGYYATIGQAPPNHLVVIIWKP